MAAIVETAPRIPSPELLDLRQLSAQDLNALLDEEIETWAAALHWDFGKSADLVRRFVDLHALNGCALIDSGHVMGYAYFVIEDHKGLIGDLYLRHEYRTVENEDRLIEAILDALMGSPSVRRIESQLMMLASGRERAIPGSRFLSGYDRNFMMLDLTRAARLPANRVRPSIYLEKWAEHHQEPAAQLIASAYVGHIDSRINDQYRSNAGARRFLFNIVQYPGCGSFFKPASFAAFAFDEKAHRAPHLCGLCLCSLVGPEAGHITQICVSKDARKTGVGYELLRESLEALRESGCRTVSLTVTAANREAVRLYQAIGFKTVRRFSAHVWEGF